jgi:hypothetical protein
VGHIDRRIADRRRYVSSSSSDGVNINASVVSGCHTNRSNDHFNEAAQGRPNWSRRLEMGPSQLAECWLFARPILKAEIFEAKEKGAKPEEEGEARENRRVSSPPLANWMIVCFQSFLVCFS